MTAEQTGPDTVLILWTAPPAPPAHGYRILVTGVSTNEAGTTRTIGTDNQFGVFIIRVMSHSDHFPGQTSEPVNVTVRGKHNRCTASILAWV